ncbi:2-oxo acid dehydrogenase subunit E2 [Streptomyces sp. R302]|uniref:dihydrolipoamide acetyltransferase family protein n=1 Tax=unclassified Streptomyces TaxID=2593676 RepID=UPI00145CFF80|nr:MULTISPECIES: dihydrolipoamide acetyltransferase family protein [unclassified Streptomyces]NML52379.1 2-oxo acid dehydrogenase subunit E2 [Streptomyces sp. R301]NML82155.1 2-oxo acid dehydrogenase subunit E2 [Streptomyces sp. R302]
MAQVLEFKLPDLGEGLTEAEIVRWLVAVGDVVAIDQPVVEVETAKAMVEVPCPYGGVVTARFGEEGTELPVGAPLLTVAVGASADAGTAAPAAGTAEAPAADAAVSSEYSGNVLVGYGTAGPAARRRRIRPQSPAVAHPTPNAAAGPTPTARAAAPAAPVASVAPVAPAAPATSVAPAAPATSVAPAAPATPVAPAGGPVPVISPLVRKLARDRGLDLREVHGSGPEGLILRADVERALVERETAVAPVTAPTVAAPAVAAPAAVASAAVAPGAERIPLRGLRGAVADKLSRSRTEIPDATCWVDADATELMAARAAMNAAGGPKISLLALLARICVHALGRFPELNSTVDTAAREIVRLPQVHLGFAAQTPRGLVVPVVRDAGTRTAESLTEEFARLTETARQGTLTPADLTGGTFTLNNYGVFGVDGSTPIVNHPEAAMLGVGRIIPKPWVHQGELAVRQVVQLSLTFDHRVCDGGTAGGFLRYVADCVEQPAVLLRTV